jgi:hypothetical protein
MNDSKAVLIMKPVAEELSIELSNYLQLLAKQRKINIETMWRDKEEDELVVHMVGDITNVVILCQYLVGDYPYLKIRKEFSGIASRIPTKMALA